MAADSVLIPPIATNLNDPQGTNQTAQEWYLYWQKSGSRINTLNQMIAYGLPGNRPLPGNVPDGALYVESNDGEVLYQKQADGAWHYVAGTEWNTLNPDHRPTGLGADDAGYTYRTTDAAGAYSARTFVWSGSIWIETTASRYDTHAARLAVNISSLENGFLWVEPDRSEVLYQLQGTAWHYLAGTMWGTISPDQRPTDLGANDAGFHFRGTDQAREFIWSGTIWVEVGVSNYDVNGALIGTRSTLNLIAGTNVTISGTDNAASNRVDVTVSSSGGGTGGAVSSVFGRTGAVNALSGDYTAAQVTNAVSSISSYADPAWITALSWSKITGTPAGYVLPAATAAVLGGVKIGANVTVAADGTISVAAAPVSSVFGRTGAVVSATGDYTAAQVTNAVSTAGSYADPAWITSLAYAKIAGAPWTIVGPGIAYTGGSVGIGNASPGYPLTVRSSAAATTNVLAVENTTTGVYGAGIVFRATDSATASMYSAGRIYGVFDLNTFGYARLTLQNATGIDTFQDVLTIKNGQVGIGTISPGAQLDLSTDSARKLTTTAWATGSDVRIKRNIRDLEGGLAVINRLRPVECEHNGLGGTVAGTRTVSLIAQEVQSILPGTVTSRRARLHPGDQEETDLLDFNPHECLFHLILAVQQLDAEVKRLRAMLEKAQS